MLLLVYVSKFIKNVCHPLIKIVRKKCFLAFFFTFARGGNDYAWFNKTLF